VSTNSVVHHVFVDDFHLKCTRTPWAVLLQEAREQQIIADVDFDVVTHMLLGGLLTYVIMNLVLGEEAQPPALDRADAVVEVIMRALTP